MKVLHRCFAGQRLHTFIELGASQVHKCRKLLNREVVVADVIVEQCIELIYKPLVLDICQQAGDAFLLVGYCFFICVIPLIFCFYIIWNYIICT